MWSLIAPGHSGEEAGILTLFFLPVWCLLVVFGLLVGRKAGLLVTGGKRVAPRKV